MQVPALEHNGKVIGESLDLIKYVDSNFDGPSLYPEVRPCFGSTYTYLMLWSLFHVLLWNLFFLCVSRILQRESLVKACWNILIQHSWKLCLALSKVIQLMTLVRFDFLQFTKKTLVTEKCFIFQICIVVM